MTKLLNKTLSSINAATARGETMNGKRLQGLVDRYNDAKLDLINSGCAKVWYAFCEAHQLDNSHNAYDLVA